MWWNFSMLPKSSFIHRMYFVLHQNFFLSAPCSPIFHFSTSDAYAQNANQVPLKRTLANQQIILLCKFILHLIWYAIFVAVKWGAYYVHLEWERVIDWQVRQCGRISCRQNAWDWWDVAYGVINLLGALIMHLLDAVNNNFLIYVVTPNIWFCWNGLLTVE